MIEANPVIGSGFDEARGTFAGDTQSNGFFYQDSSNKHPFHNVDHNTMMAMRKALVVLQKVKGDNSVHQIAERIYLGSIGAALNLPELQTVGITHIMCTATGVRSMHPDKFVYKTSELLLDHFADTIYWMECALRENPNHKILVHCFAGRSRSVAVVLAYLMYKLHIPLSVALLHVRQFRASANPNSGFINQLKAFEHGLLSSNRSFSFDTLWTDLDALIGPAKELLKTMPITELDSRRSSGSNGRSSSASILSVPLSSVGANPRTKSTDATIDVSKVEISKSTHLARFESVVRWVILLLLLVLVIASERLAFPHYAGYLCGVLKEYSLAAQHACSKVPGSSELTHLLPRVARVVQSYYTAVFSS